MKDESDTTVLLDYTQAGGWNVLPDFAPPIITEPVGDKAIRYWQDLACANRKVAEDNQTKLAAAQADADRWKQFLRNPYAAWDRIRDKLGVDSPAYWSKQANAGIDSFKEEMK